MQGERRDRELSGNAVFDRYRKLLNFPVADKPPRNRGYLALSRFSSVGGKPIMIPRRLQRLNARFSGVALLLRGKLYL